MENRQKNGIISRGGVQQENQDWAAINRAAKLLDEVKDIREEIIMLQALLFQQQRVWRKLVPKNQPNFEDMRGIDLIVQDMKELGDMAQNIQQSVIRKSTLSAYLRANLRRSLIYLASSRMGSASLRRMNQPDRVKLSWCSQL